MAGAGLVDAGPPTRAARRARTNVVLLRPDDDSACFAPSPRSCHDRHPGWGLSNIRQTAGWVSR